MIRVYPVWWGVSYDNITSLHFCEKGVKRATRNYQRDILTNVMEPLNQTMFQNKPDTPTGLHLRRRPKLCNSGLKIIYPNLLLVTIGRQRYS